MRRALLITLAGVLLAGCASSAPAERPGARAPFVARSLVLEQGEPAWIVAEDELERVVILKGELGGQRWRRVETSPDDGLDTTRSGLTHGLTGQAPDGTEFELAPVYDPHEAKPSQWVLWRRRGLSATPIATLPDEAR